MKTKLQKAIANKDIEKTREIVIDLIDQHPDKRSTLDAITELVRKFPEVFVDDENDMRNIERKDYSLVRRNRLRERLQENFSREKLSLYVDMAVSMARHPKATDQPMSEDIVLDLIDDEFSFPLVGSLESPKS